MALETVEDIAEVYGIAVDLDDFHQLLGQEKVFFIMLYAVYSFYYNKTWHLFLRFCHYSLT